MYKVNEKRFSISLKSKRKYRKLNVSQNNSLNLLAIQFSGNSRLYSHPFPEYIIEYTMSQLVAFALPFIEFLCARKP